MFGLFTLPARTRRPDSKGRALLSVEPFEPRDCPAPPLNLNVLPGTALAQALYEGEFALHAVFGPVADSVPVHHNPGRTAACSERVTDEYVEGRTVAFGEAPTDSAVSGADRTFSPVAGEGQPGLMRTTTQDAGDQANTRARGVPANTAPVITDFQVIQESGNTWIFSGQVLDENAAGLQVQLGGIPSLLNQTATVDESGWFFLQVTLGEDEEGTATAQTTDRFGLESNVAEVPVRQN